VVADEAGDGAQVVEDEVGEASRLGAVLWGLGADVGEEVAQEDARGVDLGGEGELARGLVEKGAQGDEVGGGEVVAVETNGGRFGMAGFRGATGMGSAEGEAELCLTIGQGPVAAGLAGFGAGETAAAGGRSGRGGGEHGD